MLNALFGLAYGPGTPIFPQLAAPNPAPKPCFLELARAAQRCRSLIVSLWEWQLKAASSLPAVASVPAKRWWHAAFHAAPDSPRGHMGAESVQFLARQRMVCGN
jgi:hypothetical protein